jgi:S-adenosylmethionine:tRNA ribosyltransferase-isomerase
MRTEDSDYILPPDLIAQTPVERGESRLLVLHREDGRIDFRQFGDLLEYLRPDDTLVVNDTRVTARRLVAEREGGQPAEVLLLRPVGETDWHALVRPGKRLRPGASVTLRLGAEDVKATILEATPEGGRVLRLPNEEIRDQLAREGTAPLPPYIHAALADEDRYQTVYAGPGGSAAAPTAGLHFTEEMLAKAEARGIRIARATLHVGVDTFRPVKVETLEEHVMHGEWYTIPPETAQAINSSKGRVVAVGTTVVRALESAATGLGTIEAVTAQTRLFITPGFRFQVVQVLLTNFHLPKSTLLMLVSAFAGREPVLAAYRAAVEARFRFFSFGDAMLIV